MSFLGLDTEEADPRAASVAILPVPYEASVSYGGGTGRGPAAILAASTQVELYDVELDDHPHEIGICTLPPVELPAAGPEAAVWELRRTFDRLLEEAPDRLVIALGGEHSISSAPILAHADRLGEDARLCVLQLDAHADLRPAYQGTAYSHASVMARVVDEVDIVAAGIRSLSAPEREVIRERDTITTVFAHEMDGDDGWVDRVMEALGEPVYLTLDVDYFDPSLVPSTGTPEPGGAGWYPTLRLLRRLFAERTVVGADVVELAPVPGLHAPDFLVARLVHKLVGYRAAALG